MARRTVLTSRQRSALFALPQREADLLRHYTLSDEDLQNIGARRRPATSWASRCSCACSATRADCWLPASSCRRPSWVSSAAIEASPAAEPLLDAVAPLRRHPKGAAVGSRRH